MSDINIYFSDDSELVEYESSSRGYRTDVYVEINNNIFNVRVYAMIRLQQDFESEIESYGFFAIEPNIILVKDANKEEIVSTIIKLNEQKYFEEIKSLENVDISKFKKVQ